jgi:hypothetical protein
VLVLVILKPQRAIKFLLSISITYLRKREENSFALHSGEFALRPWQLYHQLLQTATEKGRNRDSLLEWCGARIAVPGWPFRD